MQAQQAHAQQSVTSLARYAPPRTNGADPFHGYENRDFCNSFWGQGDAGPNVLFARMRGAERTTDELRNFWHDRTAIEEEYAQKLAKLAKVPIGVEEVGELRESLNILRRETEVQATSHLELAQRMRDALEEQTAEFHRRQLNHRRTLQAAVEKKLKARQQQESFATRAREKYIADLGRVTSYTQQQPYTTAPADAQRLEQKLIRTKETAKANEKDFITFTQNIIELLAEWQTEWKNFCDACHDLEEDRLEFMKDNIWAYANEVSTLCVSDDQSCERVREALDVFEPERDVLNFAEAYGSGNELPQPPTNPIDANGSAAPTPRFADYQRKSHRVPRPYPGDVNGYEPEPPNPVAQQQNGAGTSAQAPEPSAAPRVDPSPAVAPPPVQPSPANSPMMMRSPSLRTAPTATTSPGPSSPPQRPTPSRRNSASRGLTLPTTPNQPNGLPPNGASANDKKILFYVRALYDYTATIDEEFDFQAGDIIAVTAAPEDGWWSGELLDEARKVEGKYIFPSNFVCLF